MGINMDKKLFVELRFLFKYVKSSKRSFILFFIGWHLEAFINLMLPLLFGRLIDEMVYYKNVSNLIKFVFVIIILSLFLCSLYFLIYTFYNYNYGKYATNIKLDLMNHMTKLDGKTMQSYKNGEIITMVDQYADECVTIVNRNVIYTFYCLFIIIIYTASIFIVNARLGICTLVFVILSTIISLKKTKKINQNAEKEKRIYGKYSGWLMEMIHGVRDLRLLGAEHRVLKKFKNYIHELQHINFNKRIFGLHINNLAEAITLVFRIILLCIGAKYISDGIITLGIFIVILSYYDEIRQNILYLNGYYVDLQDRISYVRYIRKFLKLPQEKQNSSSENVRFNTGDINFENIVFSYNECELLNRLNLHIKNKDHVALVGKSGCGKTTLMNLLIAMIHPSEGNISIDGNNINNIRISALRKQIGIVHQQPYLFNGTIKQNLLYGNLHATEIELIDACKKAHIYDYITSLEAKMDTLIGEGGVSLSGGQAQRIAIARILLKNPPIIIFDESTSALDSETENSILDEWDLFIDKTIIVVSHKISSIMRCNKIAIIENGVISDYGDADAIAENNTYFKHLFSIN